MRSNRSHGPGPVKGGLEARLRMRRAELLADYEACLAVLREPASVDLDNDEAGDQEGRSDAAAMADHLFREIQAIDVALARLAKGQYGICVDCGRRIARGRLAANPTARRCIGCQVRSERMAG